MLGRNLFHQFRLLLILAFAGFLISCSQLNELPALDETGDESATQVDNGTSDGGATQKMILNQAMNIRYEKNGILELKVELPAGTQIQIPSSYQVKHLDFRNSSGSVDRSSTGFITPVTVISVPSNASAAFPDSKIAEINKTSGGLFVGAAIVGSIVGVQGDFASLAPGAPGEGFTKNFQSTGKPKFSYITSVNKRFSARLNKGVAMSSLSNADQVKWQKIYSELKKAVDRTVATPKSFLMIDQAAAMKWSQDFEKTGVISPNGAWTIAVNATAVRHGFPNVPCAEFQSELLREAYQRAGYRVTDDFNKTKGNELIWSKTASVVGFSAALNAAGWVPWDATKYRPITGAFMMHAAGYTPGHTFISAGDDGRFIVDNGAPQGRDLRKTSASTIEMMFQVGVFFLPPGISPPAW